MSFDKVLTLPFRDNGFVKLLIGGVLQILPVINFFSLGYTVECYQNGAYNRERMPEWTDWGRKFVDGLCLLVISVIYLLIPLLLFSSTGFFTSLLYPGYDTGIGTFLPGVLVFIIFSFALPMAIANYAVKKNFGAAFQFGHIFKLIGSSIGSYIGAYFLYLIAAVICFLVALIPIIGWIFCIFMGFYLGCVAGFLFGSVYGKACNLYGGSDKFVVRG